MLPTLHRNWLPTMFDDFFNHAWNPLATFTTPAVNIKEDATQFVMEFAVPGIQKEFCRVHFTDDGKLDVAIENKLEHKDEDKKEHFLRREFYYSNYQQTFKLPENVDREKIVAKVCCGILSVTIPKLSVKEAAQAQRQIEIS